jgi:peptidoglycan/LPS O-acetylase OafA/YrhL
MDESEQLVEAVWGDHGTVSGPSPRGNGREPLRRDLISSPLVNSRRIRELDGLRGTAILLVLIFHCFTEPIGEVWPNPLSYMKYATRLTWTGVDLFFVLSGFLIGGILLDARESPRYFQIFYFRRACRILPAYLFYLAVIVACYMFFFPLRRPMEDAMFLPTMPWYSYLSLTQNFWMAVKNTAGAPVLAVTWSLAVEEQFYISLPAVIRAVPVRKILYVLVGGILLAPILRIVLLLGSSRAAGAVFTLLPCRMDSLLLGVLLALLLRRDSVWRFAVEHGRWLWAFLAILALGIPFFNLDAGTTTLRVATIGYDWFALFYATILVIAVTQPNSLLGRVLRNRVLRGLGAVAYLTYLIHTVVFVMFMALVRHHGNIHWSVGDLAASAGAMFLSVAIAKISWEAIEKGFVHWGHSMKY